jgi:hypothetical protein
MNPDQGKWVGKLAPDVAFLEVFAGLVSAKAPKKRQMA